LGVRTTTGDSEGQVLQHMTVNLQRSDLDAVLANFVGEVEQLPPMHSALKKDGKALYEYARAGVEVERQARRIQVHALTVLHWSAAEPERLVLDVQCSKGTYVRTLAEDIGAALGCGASLSGLRRTASGSLSVAHAVTLEALEGMNEDERMAQLHPVDALLAQWPEVMLEEQDAGRFITGLRRRLQAADCPAVRVYGPPPTRRVLLGSAHIKAGELIPDRLLSPPEIQAQLA